MCLIKWGYWCCLLSDVVKIIIGFLMLNNVSLGVNLFCELIIIWVGWCKGSDVGILNGSLLMCILSLVLLVIIVFVLVSIM